MGALCGGGLGKGIHGVETLLCACPFFFVLLGGGVWGLGLLTQPRTWKRCGELHLATGSDVVSCTWQLEALWSVALGNWESCGDSHLATERAQSEVHAKEDLAQALARERRQWPKHVHDHWTLLLSGWKSRRGGLNRHVSVAIGDDRVSVNFLVFLFREFVWGSDGLS